MIIFLAHRTLIKSTLGITRIENSKMEGNQGLQLTIVYRLNQTTHTFGPSHRDEVSTGPPKLKPNVDYAWEEFDDDAAREYLNDHTRFNGTLLGNGQHQKRKSKK